MKEFNDAATNNINNKAQTNSFDKANGFPVVGIGASAGGIEALEEFLSKVPANCGMAFVIVQHLAPNYKDIMCDLLQRVSLLKVQQVTDGIMVEPNNVYVIPPGYDLSMLNGILLLIARQEHKGLHLPIDYFFHSLAVDKKAQSIAVILSGMGSDGTSGLRKIKEHAGAVFVQSPHTAKFDAMPQSAIRSKLVDVIAPAGELMAKIVDYLEHEVLKTEDYKEFQSDIDKVLVLLRTHTGHDFSHYKKSTIYRRIERRMALHQFTSVSDYVNYLVSNTQENELLFKELLIGVTNFFRDQKVWQQLKTEVIPRLLAKYPKGGTLRAWVPACSSGEEAYTLAIVFQESLKKLNLANHFDLQIFATDLNNEAITEARKAFYSQSICEHVPNALLKRYFVQVDGGYRVGKQTREMVIFAQQNLIMDPPFTKLDIISCRNLFIYLEAALQKTIFPLFHYSLKKSGVLVLGTSETVGKDDKMFTPIKGTQRIYKRRDMLEPVSVIKFPSRTVLDYMQEQSIEKVVPEQPQGAQALNLQELTQSLLHEHFTPAALITTEQADIIYINGKTGNYLEPATGKVSHNLFAMARKGLAAPLNEVFHRAIRQQKTLELKNIEVSLNDTALQVDVCIKPLLHIEELRGMVLVLFTVSASQVALIKEPITASITGEHMQEIETLKHNLYQAREELQITTKEMQHAQEKLKSANEELQSTNEELQSTNEELTTSKEEMQSMNEELQTVNHELNSKVSELSEASDDMKNILNSTNIATLFLDNQLRVRRYTTQTLDIFKLISSDVGRPITDLVSSLIYPTLAEDVNEVLRSLIFHEKEIKTTDGSWYIVRIMPYRTQENLIDGVVITFSNNTVNRKASIALAQSELRFRLLFENSMNAVAYKKIIMQGDKAVDFNYLEVNNSYSKITHLHDVVGKNGSEVTPNTLQSNPKFMAACARVALTGTSEEIEFYVEQTKQWFKCAMNSQEQGLFVCVTENVTNDKKNIKTINDIKLILDKQSNRCESDLSKDLATISDLLLELSN
ncbi:chemotaxis protein CheB [Thalassotalea sp. PLHSN55]|uniref:chemotaxis protein CheB n=1 Tax=Thalassotalea sp. PLHSN55 TaxID=3435888 RepID=UPI003F863669